MFPARIRFASLTAVMLFASTALSLIQSSIVAQEPVKDPLKARKIDELKKELLEAVRSAVRLDAARVQSGQTSPEDLFASTRMLAEAELDACGSDKERVAALEAILATARETEKLATMLAKSGQGRESTALRARAERLRFEIALERVKTRAAATPTNSNAGQDLRDQAALAEKQAAVKRAAVRVGEAEKTRAEARLAAIKAQVAQAKAGEAYSELQLVRSSELFKTKAIDAGLLDEQRAKLDAARAKRLEADSQVVEAESQVAIEHARIAQAQLEAEEAELRMRQLKAKLPSER
jgi:hypothetical protein